MKDSMLTYPVGPRDVSIEKFEEENELSVNIFGITEDKHILPIRKLKLKRIRVGHIIIYYL